MSWFNLPIINNRPICNVITTNIDTNKKINYKALIDTGATRTCISKNVFDDLELKNIGISQIQSASHNNYEVKTTFLNLEIPIDNTSHGTIMQNVLVVCPLSSQGIDVLIGMDIIQKGVLIIQGNMYTLAL